MDSLIGRCSRRAPRRQERPGRRLRRARSRILRGRRSPRPQEGYGGAEGARATWHASLC